MKSMQSIAVLILLGIFSLVTQLRAQEIPKHADHIMVMPDNLSWTDAPPGLPPGAKVAVIEGDPAAVGLFTMRAKVPANYKIKSHTHPADEHITVLEGACFMGMGENFDENAAKELPTGAFAVMKVGTVHYFFTREECTIQLHGMGPWGITYINPGDDPRNNNKPVTTP